MKRKLSTEISPSKKKVIKVTPQQVSNYTYTKTGLIKRFTWKTLPEHVFPLHATDHKTPYLQILARVEDFDWKKLSQKLHSSPVELTLQRCMRGTLHVFPTHLRDMVMSVYGIDEDDEDLKTNHLKSNSLFSKDEIRVLLDPITKVLKEKGPQTAVTLKKLLNKKDIKQKTENKRKETNLTASLRYLWYTGKIEYGCTNLDEVKSWKDPNRKYRNGPIEIKRKERDEAMIDLAKWYFTLYGPASINDFVWWTGLKVGECKKAFSEISEDYEKISVEGIKEDLYIHKDHLNSLIETETEVLKMERFLPYEDSIVKGYKETRWRFFNEEEDKKVMSRGELQDSVWVDGRPVGLFKADNKSKQIEITIWKNKEENQKRLEKELERFKSFGDYQKVIWK